MTVYTDQAESIRNNFMQTATFTPAVGDPVSIKVEFLEDEATEPVGLESEVAMTRRTIQFLMADLAAEPNVDETFTIGVTAYKVKNIELRDNWFMTVSVI